MDNKEKKLPKLWMIFLPVTILLVLILVLLYNFGITSKKTAKSVVEDEVTMDVIDFSSQICEELDFMTRMGMAFRDSLSLMPVKEPNDAMQMMGALCNNSNAYMIVYCDEKGIGVTQSGIKVNVGKDNFLRPDKGNEQYYAYIQKEKIMQAEAVVSVIPIIKDEKTDGYILMYYSVSRIRKLFEQNTVDENAFLIFSVDDGVVITTDGLEQELTQGTTLEQLLLELDPEAKVAKVTEAMEKQESLSATINMESGSRYVIYSPIGINDWYIAIGFEEALFNQKLTDEWESMRNLITYLLILIFTFVFGMIAITLLMNVVHLKNNKNLQMEVDMDSLTGLYNKMATEREIKNYIKDNPNLDGILFVLDVDDFKGINDKMGHLAGDAVLKAIGQYMKENFDERNIVGRAGGDEFIIFTRAVTSEQELKREIKKVSEIFKIFPKLENQEILISASIGAAVYPKDADNFEALYRAADRALYKAKENGKNQLMQCDGQ